MPIATPAARTSTRSSPIKESSTPAKRAPRSPTKARTGVTSAPTATPERLDQIDALPDVILAALQSLDMQSLGDIKASGQSTKALCDKVEGAMAPSKGTAAKGVVGQDAKSAALLSQIIRAWVANLCAIAQDRTKPLYWQKYLAAAPGRKAASKTGSNSEEDGSEALLSESMEQVAKRLIATRKDLIRQRQALKRVPSKGAKPAAITFGQLHDAKKRLIAIPGGRALSKVVKADSLAEGRKQLKRSAQK